MPESATTVACAVCMDAPAVLDGGVFQPCSRCRALGWKLKGGPKPPRTCEQCGEPFAPRGRQRFCDRDCQIRALRQRKVA